MMEKSFKNKILIYISIEIILTLLFILTKPLCVPCATGKPCPPCTTTIHEVMGKLLIFFPAGCLIAFLYRSKQLLKKQ
jgi:hypothetical protein